MRCKPLTELDNVNDDVPKYEVDSQEHFFNFGLDPFYPTGMVSYVNGKQFKLPSKKSYHVSKPFLSETKNFRPLVGILAGKK